ncbi:MULTISPECIES: phosphoribosylanthranilate isomerase [Aerococcus]|uniref:N-(5'-phosphoribosyl)anthranilate isomerase n=1 Tax=Aerococcus sanguinicola TaxID=119206 RepID=A0A5N1GN18_9LACT|nr:MULTISPECIES: phosphoribosylanthranilate isomerase [Aerococcus]KAA9300130.1 phosphoribosylanthranilate isomerase [Aerococcus sanguinicola]MDK6369472.1 phosphoribosylanthranilate isomerase [Aerococcus sp. UMB9870]MDK6679959.1 phosphoribosylanthranilate isomerase [Aerococcus sp. UMB8608]MDK6686159.1 phosphoribosylanthranilate isomerase [Aerococcus sp. UMB8623]MDK6939939.1 phosphoribosylanthranilate isomerase [Aerococcus sp. UMB8487]
MVKKQLYSIVNYNEAVQCMDAGADHIGLVPMQTGGIPAHRVPFDVVDRIYSECRRRGVKSIAIMLNKDVEEMFFIIKRLNPDIVHIAGMDYTSDQAFADRLHEECPGVKLMQAVLVDGPGAVDRAKEYAKYCDFLLTDTGLAKDTGIGASGETHDWNIDKEIVDSVDIPVVIAGGLGPDNVEECIRQIRPFGVDSLSKTSYKYEDGVIEKDIPKVQEFCRIADEVSKELGL